jgi:hypothetical protein
VDRRALAQHLQGVALEQAHHRAAEGVALAEGAQFAQAVLALVEAGLQAAHGRQQAVRLAEHLDQVSGLQARRAGDGVDVGDDPGRALAGEGHRLVQSPLAGRRGDHLALGLVDAQADPGGPGVDLQAHPRPGHLDQVARGIARAAEQVHAPS